MNERPALITAFASYKYRAKKRGIEFSISQDEFMKLAKMPCYICGAPPSNRAETYTKGKKVIYVAMYSGLDRLDNNLGYRRGNVAPCCHDCNSIKSKRSLPVLQAHLQKMIKGLKKVAA